MFRATEEKEVYSTICYGHDCEAHLLRFSLHVYTPWLQPTTDTTNKFTIAVGFVIANNYCGSNQRRVFCVSAWCTFLLGMQDACMTKEFSVPLVLLWIRGISHHWK